MNSERDEVVSQSKPIIETTNLKTVFDTRGSIVDTILRRPKREIKAVDDVSLTLRKNEVQGLIGESGCGKTTLLKTLIGLEQPSSGSIKFKGRDLSSFSRNDWKEYRKQVRIIFQDPFNTLNPRMTVEDILNEPLSIHGLNDRSQRIDQVLRDVELQPTDRYLNRLPGQLSGGEKQRVAIARALIVNPEVILADEPVSMLDVSTQASLLNLIQRLTTEYDTSMLYISHDLSTVSYICEFVNVMYLGRVVESAPTQELLQDPLHPYSKELINAIPIPDPNVKRERTQLEGSPASPIGLDEGCRFRDRCPERMDVCSQPPEVIKQSQERDVACHLYHDDFEEPNANGG